MKVHDYIKFAAVVMLIVLTVVAFRREHKHPLLVTKVSEIVVMKAAHAEEAPRKVIEDAPRKVIEKSATIRERVEAIKKKIVLPHHDAPSRTKSVDGSGTWTFPYSCSKVKWYAEHFSREQLDTMRKLAGEPEPSADQQRQIAECIAGRFK